MWANLRRAAEVHFGSITALQNSMNAAAMGMSSSGWLWLVVDKDNQLGIVATFGTGTLLVRSRLQKIPPQRPIHQSMLYGENTGATFSAAERQSNVASPTSGMARPPPPLKPLTPSRSASNHTAPLTDTRPSYVSSYKPFEAGQSTRPEHQFLPRTGEVLCPLLCISIHEHAWIGSGYGIWGKEEYLKRFWSVVDWAKVSQNHDNWMTSLSSGPKFS